MIELREPEKKRSHQDQSSMGVLGAIWFAMTADFPSRTRRLREALAPTGTWG